MVGPIMKIVTILFLLMLSSSFAGAGVMAPHIAGNHLPGLWAVQICGQKQLNAFLEKIKRGEKLGASNADKIYRKESQRLNFFDCNGRDVPEEDKISELPTEFAQFSRVEILDLGNNKLETLPPWISKFVKLEQLHLSNNKFTMIPNEIWRFPGLWRLYLGGNDIESIPSDIGRLRNLLWLYIGNNRIAELPPEVGTLTSLMGLDLGNNDLKSLPIGIVGCVDLQWLSLKENRIESLLGEVTEWLKTIKTVELDSTTS